MLNLSSCFSGFVWEKGMLRRAVCVVPHVCSVNDGKGGRCSVGDSASMPADAAVAEKKRPMLLSNAASSAPLPSLCDRSALRGVSRVRTCRAIARALTRSYFFCLHSFIHVTQTPVLHVIRGEGLCAKPSPPRQVDRVSGSSRAVIPFFLAAMPYFARVFEEKRAVFQSRPR